MGDKPVQLRSDDHLEILMNSFRFTDRFSSFGTVPISKSDFKNGHTPGKISVQFKKSKFKLDTVFLSYYFQLLTYI